jgi:anti-sigma B factor antagonist
MNVLPDTLTLQETRRIYPWGAIVDAAPGPGVAVVGVVGRFDLASAPDVQHYLVATIAAGQRRLVLDLGETTFVDSAGVRCLVDALRSAHGAGGTLRLARPGVQARLALRLAGVDRLLAPGETVAHALAGLRATEPRNL